MEQRFEAVMAVVRDGLPVVEVAAKFGVSRQSVHAWIRRYEQGGVTALEDRSHQPFGCPHQMPAAVEAELCELRRQHPGWGPTRLAWVLANRGVEPAPSRSAVYRALVRQRLIEPSHQRRRKDWVRWERHRPMELWQLDVVGGIVLADGTELKALTGIDDHSRFCVCAGLRPGPYCRPNQPRGGPQEERPPLLTTGRCVKHHPEPFSQPSTGTLQSPRSRRRSGAPRPRPGTSAAATARRSRRSR